MLYELDINTKPLMDRMELSSRRGVEGTNPSAGSHGRSTGEKKPMMFKGKGLEFEKFREFTSGDDASMIDWKASLRAKKKLVKVYEEEHNKNIIFLLDTSASMCYSSWGKMKCEYAAEMIISMAFALSESGDNLGLVMFSDRIEAMLNPVAGRNQYFKIVKTLTNPAYYNRESFDISKALNELYNFLKRKAMILVFSDFIGLKDDWETTIKASAGNFEIIGLMVRDPVDDILPYDTTQIVVSDPYSSRQLLVDPSKIKKAYDSHTKKRTAEIKGVFKKIESDAIVFKTDEPYVRKLRALFGG